MSVLSNLDRESFQTLLACAFAVQESGINTQSRSALVEVQGLIAKGRPDFGKILDLIADRARIVAGATGIAIGLLKADQLVYQAASGSAAKCVGRRVNAVLSVSAHNGARKEILRVENAATDTRIEASICRQRDAKALLIIPICREGSVAGVMEVLFNDAHTFQDGEMRTYRVMAGLVEDAMLRDIQLGQKRAPSTQPPAILPPFKRTASQAQQFCGNDTASLKSSNAQVSETAAQVRGKVPVPCPATVTPAVTEPLRRALLDGQKLKAAAAVIVIALGIASWIAFGVRRALTIEDSAIRRPSVVGQHVLQRIAKPSPSRAPRPHSAAGRTESAKASRRSAFRRVRVGSNEIDDIAEDVTIRRFTTKPAPPHVRGAYKQVNIGDDVKVLYFAQKPEIVPLK